MELTDDIKSAVKSFFKEKVEQWQEVNALGGEIVPLICCGETAYTLKFNNGDKDLFPLTVPQVPQLIVREKLDLSRHEPRYFDLVV